MTLSVDDYEKAIARIFDAQGNVIGTGFLVAPGYVLTCAHVVLQAIGIAKEQFAEYKGEPQELITLDFHVLASGQRIEAEVVAWLPYSLDSGDVAALRLNASAPEGVKPVPLVTVTRAEVEHEPHSVYGFGRSASGGRSDAYRPKANVAGGRFQLCKVGDPNDETIRPGFSGAPVWNETRSCVIGMVATAVVAQNDQQSLAYAIPTQALHPLLKQVKALTLYDVLQQGLDNCANEDDRYRFNVAIEATLRRCNPNGGDRPWLTQLRELALDRPPIIGWESESHLIYFAVMLAWENIPKQAGDQIQAWVDRHNVSFLELLGRMTLDMKQKKVSASTTCDHVMVTVEPVEGQAQDDWRVSIWTIANLTGADVTRLPQAIVQDEVLALRTLPEFIQRQCRRRFGKTNVPLIHLFVPRSLLCCAIEMQPFGRLQEMLGSVYPFVIRTNLAIHPIGRWYYDDWQEKWKRVDQDFDKPADQVFEAIDCTSLAEADGSRLLALIDALADRHVVILQKCESFEDLFDLLVGEKDSALPVALWTRDPKFEADLPSLLDGIVRVFPERIRQERTLARRTMQQVLVGHHLSLVWEDPNVVPPDMQFDPEAC